MGPSMQISLAMGGMEETLLKNIGNILSGECETRLNLYKMVGELVIIDEIGMNHTQDCISWMQLWHNRCAYEGLSTRNTTFLSFDDPEFDALIHLKTKDLTISEVARQFAYLWWLMHKN